jgi:hypothetical protein
VRRVFWTLILVAWVTYFYALARYATAEQRHALGAFIVAVVDLLE